MYKVTKMGWPNLGVRMVKFGANWLNWSYLPLSNNPCDPHELTAALSHVRPLAKGDETL